MIRWLDSQWTSTIQGPKSQKVHRLPGTFFWPLRVHIFQTCSKVLNSSHWLPIPNTNQRFPHDRWLRIQTSRRHVLCQATSLSWIKFSCKHHPVFVREKQTNSEQKNCRCPYRNPTSTFFAPENHWLVQMKFPCGTLCLFSGAKMLFVIFGRVKYRSNYNIPSEFFHYH